MINSPLQDCEDDELTCDNKNCVDKILECDGEDDCMDGTDENNCPGKNCDNFIIRTRIKFYSNFRKFVLTLFLQLIFLF